MKYLVFVAILTGFLSACGGGSGSGNNSNPSAPAQSENPVPAPKSECKDCEPQVEPNRLSLTAKEVEDIQFELQKTAQTENWEVLTLRDKGTLIGAWLYQSTEKVKPLNWMEMTDEDLNYLMKLFFSEDLKLKDN